LLLRCFCIRKKALWALRGCLFGCDLMSVAIANGLWPRFIAEALGSGYSSLTHLLSGVVILYSLFFVIVVKKNGIKRITIWLGHSWVGLRRGQLSLLAGFGWCSDALIFDNDVACLADCLGIGGNDGQLVSRGPTVNGALGCYY